MLRNFTKCDKRQQPPVREEIKAGDIIPYLDRRLEVLTTRKSGKINHVRLESDRVIVSTSSNKELNVVLKQWYRIQAAKLIKERLDRWGDRLNVGYNRVTIRGQKTRWGSCSHKGNLSFNWRLLMVPEPVLNYVIIHELAHIKEMNHSKKFWQLVTEHCPHWREHRKWLRVHESALTTSLFAGKS